MFEYVFGFLVGAVTMHLAYSPQFKQLDKDQCSFHQTLEEVELQQKELMKLAQKKYKEREEDAEENQYRSNTGRV